MNNFLHALDTDWLNQNMAGRPAHIQGVLLLRALDKARQCPDGVTQANVLEALDRMLHGAVTIEPKSARVTVLNDNDFEQLAQAIGAEPGGSTK